MTLNTIYNIYLYENDIDFLRYLLGLINSKHFQFYWDKKYYDNKATFPKIKKAPLESLPIKDSEESVLVSEVVREIINQKDENPEANTTELENQIDQLVYQLYDLTEEEIAIIENSGK